MLCFSAAERSLIRRQLGGSGGEGEETEGQRNRKWVKEARPEEDENQARYIRLCNVNFLSF